MSAVVVGVAAVSAFVALVVAVVIIARRRRSTLAPLAAAGAVAARPTATRRNVEIDAGVVVARNDHVVINLDNEDVDSGEESD